MRDTADIDAMQRDYDRQLPDDYAVDSEGNEYDKRCRFDNYIEGLEDICVLI